MSRDIKKQLRLEALARRDALDPQLRIEAALSIAETGPSYIDVETAQVVSGFLPIRSELDTRPLLDALRRKGARLCVPAVLDKTTIVFRELVRGAPLIDTGFGTSGPGPEAEILDPDIMLVPLAAFDARGHRIGYGAGHYDRAIARLHDMGRSPRLIGIAFDCQEVANVPDEPHDVILAGLLSESGWRSFGTS